MRARERSKLKKILTLLEIEKFSRVQQYQGKNERRERKLIFYGLPRVKRFAEIVVTQYKADNGSLRHASQRI